MAAARNRAFASVAGGEDASVYTSAYIESLATRLSALEAQRAHARLQSLEAQAMSMEVKIMSMETKLASVHMASSQASMTDVTSLVSCHDVQVAEAPEIVANQPVVRSSLPEIYGNSSMSLPPVLQDAKTPKSEENHRRWRFVSPIRRAINNSKDKFRGLGPDTCPRTSQISCDEKDFRLDCKNVHGWVVSVATDPRTPFGGIFGAMLFGILFILLQFVLLGSTLMESSFPRCSTHQDCRMGEWCSPSLMGVLTTSPGVCFDCWSAHHLFEAMFLGAEYRTFPDPYEKMAAAAGEGWIMEGSRHCNETDFMPGRCDFLTRHLMHLSIGNIFVIFMVAVFVVVPIMNDMCDAGFVDHVIHWRISRMKGSLRRNVVRGLWWINIRLRMFILPLFTIGCTVGLILSAPMTSYNVLLNGVAITFVTELDDILGVIFCFGFMTNEGEPSDPAQCLPFGQLLHHRIHTGGYFIALVYSVMFAESLLPQFGNENFAGEACSDIREAALGIPLLVTLCMSVQRAIYHHGHYFWLLFSKRELHLKGLIVLVVDAFLSPTLIYKAYELSSGQLFFLKMQAGWAWQQMQHRHDDISNISVTLGGALGRPRGGS